MALLDGLRGIAALSVVLWHYSNVFNPLAHASVPEYRDRLPLPEIFGTFYNHGVYAVQLFWIISGFVFAYVYFGRTVSVLSFARSRFARLYPLHIVTLLVVALLQFVSLHKFGRSLIFENNDLYHFGLQLFFASNWGLEDGYSFNGPIWSVSAEVLIYAAFFLLLPILPRWGIAIPLAAALISLLLRSIMPGNPVLNCGFYFFVGSALSVAHAALPSERLMRGILVTGLAAVGALALAYPSPSVNQVIGLPAAFGAFILAISYLDNFAGARLAAASVYIGDTTYGVYLWHIPLQMALFVLLVPRFDLAVLASSGWFLLTFIALVMAVARLSFVYIESPASRYFHRRSKLPIAITVSGP